VTLKEVFEDYCLAHQSLKASTLHDYRRIVFGDLKDWLNRPIGQISKDAVATRHRCLGERSHARANNAMRVLRALFNFARGQYEDAEGRSLFLENPVSRPSHTRAWYPDTRRRTVISRTQLAPWLQAVIALKGDASDEHATTVADYLLLLLFTGMRRTEGMTLTWNDVDLAERTLLISETKNKEPLKLPLSDFIYTLLKDRQEAAVTPYVFPGDGEYGHLIEPRKQMRKVIKASGVTFTLHDLRRTFITAAEGLDISMYAIKRLVNHKMNGDVTAGYIVPDAERLRVPMQQITDYLLSVGGLRDVSMVIPFRPITEPGTYRQAVRS
jgi:integrase